MLEIDEALICGERLAALRPTLEAFAKEEGGPLLLKVVKASLRRVQSAVETAESVPDLPGAEERTCAGRTYFERTGSSTIRNVWIRRDVLGLGWIIDLREHQSRSIPPPIQELKRVILNSSSSWQVGKIHPLGKFVSTGLNLNSQGWHFIGEEDVKVKGGKYLLRCRLNPEGLFEAVAEFGPHGMSKPESWGEAEIKKALNNVHLVKIDDLDDIDALSDALMKAATLYPYTTYYGFFLGPREEIKIFKDWGETQV